MLLETVFVRIEHPHPISDLTDGKNDALFAVLWDRMEPGKAYTVDEARVLVADRKQSSGIQTAEALLRLVRLHAASFTARYRNPARDPGQSEPNEEGFYMVWTKPDPRFPRSQRSPKTTFPLNRFDYATQAAEQMAKNHPEQKFFVLKAVRVIERTVQTAPKELA